MRLRPRPIALTLAAAAALAAGGARAQSAQLTHTGYLLDTADSPINGEIPMKFRIFNHPTGSAPAELVWQSDDCTVAAARGFYATVLGGTCNRTGDALSLAHVPAGSTRYLELAVNGITLSPRMVLASLPSAIAAMTSADAQALKTALGTSGTINAPTNPVEWTALKGVPAALADGTDADTTYSAAAQGGLSLVGTQLSIASGGVTNEMLQSASIAVTAGAGLTGGGSVALGASTTLALADVSPSPAGTFPLASVTVDAKGRVTSASAGSAVTSVAAGTGLAGGTITGTGTLSIAAGGVTNTQLARDGASLFKVSDGLMNVSGTNVGIGNANPGAMLEIRNGTSGVNSELRIFKSAGADTDRASLKIGYDDAASFEIYRTRAAGTIYLNSKQNEPIQFQTAGANTVTFAGANVGIGTTTPTTKLQVSGGIRAGPNGRIEYGWYQTSEEKTANYLHIKTNLWAGGAPAGNSQYIMGGFHATGYNYDGSVIDSYWMFHNWNGGTANLVIRNHGNYPYANTVYASADGYIVIVANYTGASYIGATFDLIQSYAGYPWRTISVTGTKQTNSATGAY